MYEGSLTNGVLTDKFLAAKFFKWYMQTNLKIGAFTIRARIDTGFNGNIGTVLVLNKSILEDTLTGQESDFARCVMRLVLEWEEFTLGWGSGLDGYLSTNTVRVCCIETGVTMSIKIWKPQQDVDFPVVLLSQDAALGFGLLFQFQPNELGVLATTSAWIRYNYRFARFFVYFVTIGWLVNIWNRIFRGK